MVIMTATEQKLYTKICNFKLDETEGEFPFSAKLAWEYQWNGIYTFRAIQEYKKFVFLAMVTDHVVSPSAIVDRVWHLHLLYTHSYWDKFCGELLGKPLHHNPSLGGKQESLKYYHLYQQTIEIYQRYFGDPPADIWHHPGSRSEKISGQWIDRDRYWVIPKPMW
jgi:hypothetical protein